MALSNAERQARHRERVRQRLASMAVRADPAQTEPGWERAEARLDAMVQSWQSGGQRLLEYEEPWIDAVVAEFMALPPPTLPDVLKLVEEAAHACAVQIMERHAAALAEEVRKRPVYQPPELPKPKRRRKLVT